jgi:NitT/TauT family transport system ATP-binding protein
MTVRTRAERNDGTRGARPPHRDAEVGDTGGCRLTNVSVAFPDPSGGVRKAVDRVDMRIGSGEIVCLVGPSGCGKTTVLNLLAGFLSPTEGSITVAGRAVRKPGPDRPVVFQTPNLFPWLDVIHNVTLGSRKRGEKKEDYLPHAQELLRTFGLADFQKYLPHQLSGGMKQRVQLARALMGSPDLILMDEPFGALDSQTRLAMQEQLLTHRGVISCAVLFITHDVDEAVYLGDRVYVMSKRPGTIHEELAIQLPSRTYEVLGSPEFGSYKTQILKLLHSS